MSTGKQSQNDHYGKMAAIYFLFLLAIVALGIASFSIYDRRRIRQIGISEIGTVYKIEHITNTDTDVLVFNVKFAYAGYDYNIHNDNMTIDNRYRLHEKLKVMFLKDFPEKAIIDDPRENGVPGHAIFLIIGFALLAFAIYLMRAENKLAVQIR
ncbi:DUF3592 domain-containing protein [Hymenobacter antarcticus]|uniref:DUF3592 domain-containing protein n=1 Tax=Hymenobacter antarcticus TaxID=486270 RepID=A0ABP7QVN0_9BACT